MQDTPKSTLHVGASAFFSNKIPGCKSFPSCFHARCRSYISPNRFWGWCACLFSISPTGDQISDSRASCWRGDLFCVPPTCFSKSFVFWERTQLLSSSSFSSFFFNSYPRLCSNGAWSPRQLTFSFRRLKKNSRSPCRALSLVVQCSVKWAEKLNILVLACWVRVY